jgi:hypothetical protein
MDKNTYSAITFFNKIEHHLHDNSDTNIHKFNMRPIYSTNRDLMCTMIHYNNKEYLIDFEDNYKIINHNKTFAFFNEDDDYPSFCYNYKRFNYLHFIFDDNFESTFIVFKNNNKFDMRRCNVEIFHNHHKIISDSYNVIECIYGHYLKSGQTANMMKNPMWKINEKGKEYLLMYCEKDTICKLCDKSYQQIVDFEKNHNNGDKCTFWKAANGYISTHWKNTGLYIHQIITGCYGNGKGTKNISVDHIDQNPLNNTLDNLRIATRKEQEENSNGIKDGTKRGRNWNAKSLPEGITQDMLKKYVVYYEELYNKEQHKTRYFFKVEHPGLDKPWATTKSNKVSITDKLAQANKVVDELENNVYPEKEQPILPKYVSLIFTREKPHLVFEKRIDGKRLGLKMVLPTDYDMQEQLSILNDKINGKYEGESIL